MANAEARYYLTTERSGAGDEIVDDDAEDEELAGELLMMMSDPFAVSRYTFSPVMIELVLEALVMCCPDPMGYLRRRMLE